ncbi:anthranilate phosphoribosyltransferase, partial [Candidatus Poribacteria bacterium]|nr:anthranilate phosphoribosyltransferase [Candidatus Poribacteria bacterium]
MLKEYLNKLIDGNDLTKTEASTALQAVLDGADPQQMAAMLVLLRAKGESPAEVAGFAHCMLDHVIPVSSEFPLLDTCG